MAKSKLPKIYWEDGYTPGANLSKGFGWLIDRRIPDVSVGCFSQDFECYEDNKIHVQCYTGLDDRGCEKKWVKESFDSFEEAREFIGKYWKENGKAIIESDRQVREANDAST